MYWGSPRLSIVLLLFAFFTKPTPEQVLDHIAAAISTDHASSPGVGFSTAEDCSAVALLAIHSKCRM
jgi:hypothetical protein